ncbi:type I secretion system permease/ATPase [Variovorax sp. KK3]|uniref:type I secretion system permease/ATPase n=1 Tax=Variovorax sp. KK3 TaxID=1855728 RepID=UPI0015C3B442|nr:ATP-binding cassette domain-containing protein [Variovorax sp. KK3]
MLAGAVAHLLLLVPTLVTLQIYDRVLSSRRMETLGMLLVAAGLSLSTWWLVETARVRWHAARACELEQHFARDLVPWLLHMPGSQATAASQQLWRDLAALRAAAGGPLTIAVTDLPWTPVYLLVIAAFHPWLGAVALAGVLVLLALAWLTERRLREPAVEAEQAQADAQRKAGEVAGCIDMLQSHGQQTQVGDSLLSIKSRAARVQLEAELPGHSLKTAGKLARQSLQVLMLATGAWLVASGHATGGVMVAGSILLGKALMPLEVLIGGWKPLLEARKALDRLLRALAAQAAHDRLIPETILPPSRGALRVSGLGVRPALTGRTILHALDFALPPGSMLAVLGPSGCGKSTLARVLAGVQPQTHGEVALDGAALHQYSQQARGQATGYLPQDILLHSGSVAHNIARLWQPVDELTREQSDAVVDAARRAGAHALITALPRGYDTLLGGDIQAHALSGGQRQRIALARAIYATPGARPPSLIVLDEPNSQLDPEGEGALEHCLRGLREQGSTVVAITHRPRLIELATHVLMLRDGRIEQFGPREQVRQWMAQRGPQAMRSKAVPA